jgi:hypothetical protein
MTSILDDKEPEDGGQDGGNTGNTTATDAATKGTTASTVPPCGGGMCSSSLLAPWYKPAPAAVTHSTGLKILNSLTREKEDFITMDGSNRVTWYMYVAYLPPLRFDQTGKVIRLVIICP